MYITNTKIHCFIHIEVVLYVFLVISSLMFNSYIGVDGWVLLPSLIDPCVLLQSLSLSMCSVTVFERIVCVLLPSLSRSVCSVTVFEPIGVFCYRLWADRCVLLPSLSGSCVFCYRFWADRCVLLPPWRRSMYSVTVFELIDVFCCRLWADRCVPLQYLRR